MLTEVYNNIQDREIILPSEHSGAVKESYEWKVCQAGVLFVCMLMQWEEGKKEREREVERVREKKKERKKERERETERQRQREREAKRKIETETNRDSDRSRTRLFWTLHVAHQT